MLGTILIIDAVSTNRIMLKVQLSAAWYHVVQADRLQGLMPLVRRTRPDLIVTAMALPDGSAAALHLGDRIGNVAPGQEADLLVLDLASTPAIAQRHVRADTLWEAVFPTIMMGDDRAVRDVWVGGRRVRTPCPPTCP